MEDSPIYPSATPGDAAHLSAERLAEIRAQLDVPRARNSYVTDYGVAADVIDELLEHADALSAELAALQQQAAEAKAELAEQEEDKLELLGEVRQARQLLANAEFYLSTSMRFRSNAEEHDAIALDALILEFLEETNAAYGRAVAAPSVYPAAPVPKQQKGGSGE